MAKQKVERRRHERFDLSCTTEIFSSEGRLLARTKTVNVSDGGALLSVPADSLPSFDGQDVNISFDVPRSTPNTYMLEEFSAKAKVLRSQPANDDSLAGVAIQFFRPVNLALRV